MREKTQRRHVIKDGTYGKHEKIYDKMRTFVGKIYQFIKGDTYSNIVVQSNNECNRKVMLGAIALQDTYFTNLYDTFLVIKFYLQKIVIITNEKKVPKLRSLLDQEMIGSEILSLDKAIAD